MGHLDKNIDMEGQIILAPYNSATSKDMDLEILHTCTTFILFSKMQKNLCITKAHDKHWGKYTGNRICIFLFLLIKQHLLRKIFTDFKQIRSLYILVFCFVQFLVMIQIELTKCSNKNMLLK